MNILGGLNTRWVLIQTLSTLSGTSTKKNWSNLGEKNKFDAKMLTFDGFSIKYAFEHNPMLIWE